ncbi:MAG: GGDEF domain-containing protein [Pseudomonadales bacterium]
MQPASLDDLNYRARLSQRLAALLCLTVASATAIRPLLAELSPWMTFGGIINSLVLFIVYWLIGSGRVRERAPALLGGTGSLMLLVMLSITGGASSPFAPIIPLLPMLAMMLGSTRLCLLGAGFWSLAILLDLLIPELARTLPQQVLDADLSRARSLWLLLSLCLATVFSLHVDRSLTQLKQKLRRQATIDPLTALLNRRGLGDGISREFARAARTQEPLAMLLVDVDHFKAFNDRHGHEAGDRALQRLARTLKASVRAGQDQVSRFGGEEFVILLTNTNLEQAQVAAESVRKAVASMPSVVNNQHSRLTVTVGCAALQPPFARQSSEELRLAQFEALLRQADAALYAGKDQGRNRVSVAT